MFFHRKAAWFFNVYICVFCILFQDVQAYSNVAGEFPYPIIEDTSRDLAVKLGMVDPDEKDASGMPLTCRAVSNKM